MLLFAELLMNFVFCVMEVYEPLGCYFFKNSQTASMLR